MAIVEITAEFIRRELADAEGGHDWWHTLRVLNRAREIQAEEGGDLELIELAALLHDLRDYKFEGGDTTVGPEAARTWLRSQGYPEPRTRAVARIVDAVHFKGPMEEERALSLEHAVVQDADRLDAMGAIGVARAFSYGGHFGRAMFDPERLPDSTMDTAAYRKSDGPTVNHFFEKLLLLRERMLTPTGKRMAHQAHEFMHAYLTRFLAESSAGELKADWMRLLDQRR
jgi:uncharacterized protein